jgi:hypothetical protein
MSAPYLVRNSTSAVEAWSTRRLSHEPKGWQLDLRSNLRTAIRGLSPSAALYATYTSPDRTFSDLENVLFYNVGGIAFSPLGLQTLCFERRFEEVTPPSASLDQGVAHHYVYGIDGPGWSQWRAGMLLAEWTGVTIPSVLSTSTAFAAMRTAPAVTVIRPAHTAELVLTVIVGVPPGTALSIEVMKTLIDGISASFHAHEGSGSEELERRLAVAIGGEHALSAGRLLADDGWNLLGRRKLV